MLYHINELTTLYVSQKGSALGLGMTPNVEDGVQGPAKSLEQAFKRIREMRRGGMRQPVTIRILDDCYVVDKTIECPADVENIIIEGQPTGTLISGGAPLTGFQEIEKDGLRCFVTDLPKNAVPADLYVDGIRSEWTRYPQNTTLEPEDVEVHNGDLWAGSWWFIAKPEDVAGLDQIETMTVSFQHFWIDEHTPVASFDPQTRKVRMKYRTRFSVYYAGTKSRWDNAHRMKYYFENVPRLTGPNQWYFDKKAGKIYYSAANDSQTADNIVAYLPQVKTMLLIKGKRVTLRGLTFSYNSSDYASDDCRNPGTLELLPQVPYASDGQSMSNGSGVVEFLGADHCVVENCVFSHYGIYGVVGKFGCKRLRVVNSEFFDCGAGGIRLNGGTHPEDAPQELTYGCHIENNVIHDIGRRFSAGCGILLMQTYENNVCHNTIYNTYYSGISVGWVWGYGYNISRDNRIEYNHIYNIGQKRLSDMGGIYTLGRQPGTIIRYNWIHDVQSAHYGGWGIYLDEGSSEMLVENNLVYNVTCNCFYLHFGQHVTVRNNIFYEPNCSPMRYGDPELTIGAVATNNIFCTKGYPMVETDYGNNESHENLLFDYARPEPVMLTNEKKGDYSLARYQKEMGMEIDSVVADPGFADIDNYDFTLSPDSPALKLDFRPFSLDGVGARK